MRETSSRPARPPVPAEAPAGPAEGRPAGPARLWRAAHLSRQMPPRVSSPRRRQGLYQLCAPGSRSARPHAQETRPRRPGRRVPVRGPLNARARSQRSRQVPPRPTQDAMPDGRDRPPRRSIPPTPSAPPGALARLRSGRPLNAPAGDGTLRAGRSLGARSPPRLPQPPLRSRADPPRARAAADHRPDPPPRLTADAAPHQGASRVGG